MEFNIPNIEPGDKVEIKVTRAEKKDPILPFSPQHTFGHIPSPPPPIPTDYSALSYRDFTFKDSSTHTTNKKDYEKVWVCQQCNKMNLENSTGCPNCGWGRPNPVVILWVCGKCDNVNFLHNEWCVRCEKHRTSQ